MSKSDTPAPTLPHAVTGERLAFDSAAGEHVEQPEDTALRLLKRRREGVGVVKHAEEVRQARVARRAGHVTQHVDVDTVRGKR